MLSSPRGVQRGSYAHVTIHTVMSFRRILLLSLIAFSLVGTALTQSTPLSEKQFYKLVSRAEDKYRNTPRRETTTRSGYYQGIVEQDVWEFGSNDSSRWSKVTTTNGRETDRVEMIQVGNFHYVLQSDGSWKKRDGRRIGIGEGMGIGFGPMIFPVRKSDEYRDLGLEKLGGVSTRHYRHVHTETFPPSGLPAERVSSSDYWLRSDGFLVKRIDEGNVADSTRRYRIVTEYVYDKRLKIFPPKVPQLSSPTATNL